jgi:hypothetical protein
MPIPALDNTIGGASANSYVLETDAQSYLDARLNSDAWMNAIADDKTRALLMAAQRLDRETWLGERVNITQRLAWPRIGVAKVDGVSSFYGGFYSYGWGWGYGEQYLSTEIPQVIKDAQCELALEYLGGFDDGGDDAIDSFSADGVSVKHRQSRPDGLLPPKVARLIAGLVAGNVLIRG